MTTKECGHHDDDSKSLSRRLFTAIFVFIAVVLFVILLVWLILRPSKPHFLLQDATVYAFNLSAPNFLTTTLQITLSSRNPNSRIGVYYDKIDVTAAYRSQQITLPTLLPASYQGHKDITVWSPFVYGVTVPMAPYFAASLGQELAAGTVLVNVRINGRIRWRVGTFISGKYHLNVNCPAYINFGNKNAAVGGGAGVKYQLIMDCHVDV